MTRLTDALRRARGAILIVAATYAVSVLLGAAAAHAGIGFALRMGDRIVAGAQSSPILVADRAGHHLRAAVLDSSANLGLGAVPSTLIGALFRPGLFPILIYRGWVGGIVSVDRRHASRLASPAGAAYYLTVILLQLIPYSLAGAAGLMLGGARRAVPLPGGWRQVPLETWADVGWLYGLAVPISFVASLIEFLSPSR